MAKSPNNKTGNSEPIKSFIDKDVISSEILCKIDHILSATEMERDLTRTEEYTRSISSRSVERGKDSDLSIGQSYEILSD
ncbi:MAG: hypothetical protein WCB31_12180 [Nitrososphaeraceae archaeon]